MQTEKNRKKAVRCADGFFAYRYPLNAAGD